MSPSPIPDSPASPPDAPRNANRASQGEAALLPGNRFFVRRFSVEGADVAGQVNLQLEAISPFPLEQMLVGHVVSADGKQVLAYSAHRRRFTPEESFGWPENCPVVPEFLAVCGHRLPAGGVVVHKGEERLTALAWRAGETLPTAVVVTDLADHDEAGIAHEAASQAELAADCPVEIITGQLTGKIIDGVLTLTAQGQELFTIPKAQLDDADIRDSDFLAERRKKERTNLIVWSVAQACAAVLALSLIGEGVSLFIRNRSGALMAQIEKAQPGVDELKDLDGISTRLADLGVKRLLPLEMLALVNEKRPATVEFMNISCEIKKQKASVLTKPTLTIDARTPNAGDISDLIKAVKTIPEVESVTNSEPRFRDTATTFRLEIVFKQADLLKTTEAPKQ